MQLKFVLILIYLSVSECVWIVCECVSFVTVLCL